ncbi:hypothetical protein GWI33_020229 [Rhynchophorus ferrugineus]|uniref:Uncharacterized protein n=1 Tax=Rhynchophorus ferrugineus TaxID=354439 RepID=A0A834HPW5_RHYFE|nr:hypothetical protein GWI33_020229 [Rhynchophorus ferrugineus]
MMEVKRCDKYKLVKRVQQVRGETNKQPASIPSHHPTPPRLRHDIHNDLKNGIDIGQMRIDSAMYRISTVVASPSPN